MRKDVKKYMNLPYTKIVKEINDESGHYYVCKIMELEGCMSDGDTLEEMNKNINEAMELWIESAIDEGETVPVPIDETDYSGKFVVRASSWLHQRLAIEAREQGVSLNQWVICKLAR